MKKYIKPDLKVEELLLEDTILLSGLNADDGVFSDGEDPFMIFD